ncbi:MAG TPA: 2OG-Fe(II) oxygenase [Noviherbaspirillum sp.]|nr:2OG-Fe(II) oxygenase [Noviherbaspirillum sp.]
MDQESHSETIDKERLCNPWPLLIVDNFLPGSVIAKALKDIDASKSAFTVEDRRVGRIEYDILRSKNLWRHLYSLDTINLLSATFGGSISLDARNLIQLRRSDDATPAFGIHNDFVEGEDTIVSFLYLAAGWKMEYGGELLLYSHEAAVKPDAAVEPIQNRFVAFRTLSTHWHAVAKVKKWIRLSAMALWKRKVAENVG